MKYKLIKEYPGNRDIGRIKDTNDSAYYSKYPEFWQLVPEIQYRVGDWVIFESAIFELKIRRIASLTPFEWNNDDDNGSALRDNPKYYRLATNDEIKAYLIGEAKRRGFVAGVTYKFHNSIYIARHNPEFYANDNSQYNLHCEYGAGLIYNDSDGKWAEIIKEEQIKVGDYTVKFTDEKFSFLDGISVGCKKYTRDEVRHLYDACLTFDIQQIVLPSQSVSFDIIKYVYNKLTKGDSK